MSAAQIEHETRDLVLSNDDLRKVSALLLHEFQLGLGKDTHATATVKMFPTFVRSVSDEGASA